MSKFISYDDVKEELIEEGCYIRELSNLEEDPDVSIAQARVPIGVTTRWHQLHDTCERYVILNGKGLVELREIDGQVNAQQVGPGDVVVIPAGTPQRITNTLSEDLIFLAICSPRFEMENYVDIESD